jgi:hypothetical protein
MASFPSFAASEIGGTPPSPLSGTKLFIFFALRAFWNAKIFIPKDLWVKILIANGLACGCPPLHPERDPACF